MFRSLARKGGLRIDVVASPAYGVADRTLSDFEADRGYRDRFRLRGVKLVLDGSLQDWAAYLYVRRNPRGPHAERWCHLQGCRRWFNLRRDTVTHEILAVYKMGEKTPEQTS